MLIHNAVVLPTATSTHYLSSLMQVLLLYRLVEFLAVLQCMYLKSFTQQFTMSPRKTPTQDLKQERFVSTSPLVSVRVFLMQLAHSIPCTCQRILLEQEHTYNLEKHISHFL
jgi:hypothetical protein